jgi:hypothetical protein
MGVTLLLKSSFALVCGAFLSFALSFFEALKRRALNAARWIDAPRFVGLALTRRGRFAPPLCFVLSPFRVRFALL